MSDHRPPAIFVADALGLDFLNSIATPATTTIDWLADGEGLLAWLEQAALVPPEVLARLREQAMPGELDRVAAQARDLREWFRAFVRHAGGRALRAADADDLQPLNQLLARDEQFVRLSATAGTAGGGLELRTERRWRAPESLLLPIGQALAALLAEEDFSQVKACQGPSCTLLFADHTRGRARRWCSMALCGNRAKQEAFRNRAKSAH
ncbi:CGNR zinc finger domain-containing protein [Kitasatospora viridis]|uniref:Putative RNA-binding Zn ribbon-like protein n=1 Tax=Kitasatospora viridis TaxID=281105 RepID=A0A561SE23_9ACTN|nr:ABATE domain-containing protein [Kitasatospora viridis]TWF73111.1 putative RNA-binding Zn ribbon-like protein [Kitasatospora viridis]